jgi:hypothetical protein
MLAIVRDLNPVMFVDLIYKEKLYTITSDIHLECKITSQFPREIEFESLLVRLSNSQTEIPFTMENVVIQPGSSSIKLTAKVNISV